MGCFIAEKTQTLSDKIQGGPKK